MTDTDLERRLSERLHREAAQLVPDGGTPPLPAPAHRWWQSLRAAGSLRWRAPVLVVAAVLVIGLVTAALVRWLPQHSATPAAKDALAASSRAAASDKTDVTAVVSRGGAVPNEALCVSSAAPEVEVPLATYGDLDSAALRFIGGSPPAALLCGTFTSGGHQQTAAAASTPGHIAYLFSQVNPTKVSTGGGYYWIAGAVDNTVASVVLSFPDTPTSTRVDLVPLAAGWKGFADEYSPAPIMPDESAEQSAPSVTVTALDDQGNTIETRYLDLDTGAAHQVTSASATPHPTR